MSPLLPPTVSKLGVVIAVALVSVLGAINEASNLLEFKEWMRHLCRQGEYLHLHSTGQRFIRVINPLASGHNSSSGLKGTSPSSRSFQQ